MTNNERLRLAVGVLARRHEGVYPQRRKVCIGDWEPSIHSCHENVARWVAANPQHKQVVGFIVIEHRHFNYDQLLAHSLVEWDDGSLVDITILESLEEHPFIRHVGELVEFAAMAEVPAIDVPRSV